MSVSNKTFNLIISAQNNAHRTFQEMRDDYSKLTRAAEEQVNAAKKGLATVEETNVAIRKLKDAQEGLRGRNTLVSEWERLNTLIEAAGAKIAKTSQARSEYVASSTGLKKDGTDGARRASKIAGYDEKLLKEDGALKRRIADLQQFETALSEAGVEIQSFIGKDDQVKRFIADMGLAFNRVSQSANEIPTALRQAKAALASAELGKLADDAARSATSFEKMAQVLGQVESKGASLYPTLRNVGNASAEARQTLEGLEAQSKNIAASVADGQPRPANWRRTVNDMQSSMESVENHRKLIIAYKDQADAVARLQAESDAYNAKLRDLSNTAMSGAKGSRELGTELANLQAKANTSANALISSKNKLAELDREMKTARMDSANLDREYTRLGNVARTLNGAMTRLTDSVEKNGTETRKTAQAHSLFANDGGRTTLSLMQRLRGEILSVTATYIGLYGAIEGVQKLIETGVEKQAVENRLAVVVGNDPQAIGKEYGYIHDQAERLGVGFRDMSTSYSQFATDAKFAHVALNDTRYIFERVTEAMRVNHASSADVNEGFRQMGQMLAKGKIGMDDLRAAATHIPGIEGMMAEGLAEIGYKGISAGNAVGDMLNMMKKDGVDSFSAIYGAARKMEGVYADRLPEAMRSLQAEQGRFNTKIFDFMVMVNEKGFGKAYTDFLRELTDKMDGPKAEEFAQMLSDGLTKIIDLVKLLIDNADLLGTALQTAFLVKGTYALIRFASEIPAVAGQLKILFTTVNTGAAGSISKMAMLQGSFLTLSAGIVGWQIGTYLSDNFETARLAGIALVRGLLDAFAELRREIELIGATLSDLFSGKGLVSNTKGASYRGQVAALQALEPQVSSLPMFMQADAQRKHAAWQQKMDALTASAPSEDELNQPVASDPTSAAAKVNQRYADDAKKRHAILDKMAADEISPKTPVAPKPVDTTSAKTTDPGYAGPKWKSQENDTAAAKRGNAISSIENELATMRAQLDKAETDSLESRLNQFRERYLDLQKKIAKVGGSEGAQLKGEFDKIVAEFKKNETAKYYKEIAEQQKQLVNKMDTLDNASARKFDDIVAAKKQTIADQYDQIFAMIDKYEAKLRGAKGSLTPEQQSQIAGYRMNATASRDNAYSNVNDDAYRSVVKQSVNQMNQLTKARDARIDDVQFAQQQAEISPSESYEQQQRIIAETQPAIEKMADDMLAMAQNTGMTSEQMQNLAARVDALRNSYKGIETGIYSVAEANSDLADAGTNMLRGFANGLVNVEKGTNRLVSGIRGMITAFGQFAADFLMKIAQMIIKQQILNALQSSGGSAGGAGGWLSTAVSAAAVMHTGGVVGSGGGTTRSADAAWFQNAPKYHSGGLVGLQADEYPAILKKNEEVLTADSPRNVLNSARNAGTASASPMQVKIVNAIDSSDMVREGLSTTTGEKAILNLMRNQKTQVKAILGS